MGLSLAEPDRATFVDVNRTRLRVWEWGDPDDPVILCVHGAHDHGRMFDQLAPLLAALGFHVRAIDVRGHGDSGRLHSGHMWAEAVLDLAALAAEAGGAALIGHSMGGGQVISTAAAHPEHVQWVVTIDGLGPPPWPEMSLADAAARGLDAIERAITSGPRVWPSRDAMVERRGAVNRRLPRPWVEHLVTHGSEPVDSGFVFQTDALFNTGIPDAFSPDHALENFRHVTCPVLVVVGTEPDTWSDLDDDEIDARVALFPDARLARVRGAGHYVHIERPGEAFGHIAAFIEGRRW